MRLDLARESGQDERRLGPGMLDWLHAEALVHTELEMRGPSRHAVPQAEPGCGIVGRRCAIPHPVPDPLDEGRAALGPGLGCFRRWGVARALSNRDLVDAELPSPHLELRLRGAEVVLPIVVDDVVVVKEEQHDPRRVELPLRAVEEQLLVGAVAGCPSVDDLCPVVTAGEAGLQHLGHGLRSGDGVAFDKRVPEGEESQRPGGHFVTALRVPQAMAIDRDLHRVLAPVVGRSCSWLLSPAQDRVVFDVLHGRGVLLAAALPGARNASSAFQSHERHEGGGDHEHQRTRPSSCGHVHCPSASPHLPEAPHRDNIPGNSSELRKHRLRRSGSNGHPFRFGCVTLAVRTATSCDAVSSGPDSSHPFRWP